MKGFSITLLGIAQICSWGSLYYSFPQIAEAVMVEFPWSRSQTYGALTLGLLLSAFSGLPIGRLIDQGHGRQVMTYGSLIAGLALILGSQLTQLLEFYLVFALLGFLHTATLYEAAFAIIAHRFNPLESKQHITTLTLWGGFAGSFFIPLNELILQQLNWQSLMLILGLINILLCAPIYSRMPPAQSHSMQHDAHSSKEMNLSKGTLWALKQPIFWALLVCFAFFAAASTAFKFHLYPLLLDKGLSISDVVLFLALLGPSQVAGRLILKLWGNHLSIIHLGIATAAVLPIVFAALAFLPTGLAWLLPFAILFGMATGTMTIIKGTAIPELLSQQSYGVINGAMNIPIKLIKALSPSIAAMIYLWSGSYQGLLELLVGFGLLATLSFVLASWITSKRHHLVELN